jgi:hypothetical protein
VSFAIATVGFGSARPLTGSSIRTRVRPPRLPTKMACPAIRYTRCSRAVKGASGSPRPRASTNSESCRSPRSPWKKGHPAPPRTPCWRRATGAYGSARRVGSIGGTTGGRRCTGDEALLASPTTRFNRSSRTSVVASGLQASAGLRHLKTESSLRFRRCRPGPRMRSLATLTAASGSACSARQTITV